MDLASMSTSIGGADRPRRVYQELSLLTNRLGSLSARCQREQKILTAARTLDRLHANHKRSAA